MSHICRYDTIYIIYLICSYLSFLFGKGGFSLKIPKNNLQASIVLPSILFIGIVVISCIFFPDRTDAVLSNVKEYIFSSFSWVYILCVAFFFLFLVILCLGKLGDIRLGNEGQLLPTKVGSL
ncbi:BCCT family transporter [Megasphaera elsdenii]|uniref:BCCT family transporter n=1 Tax=Megasphaera elsdenii TaxID=907 RepID=UPI003464D55D